MPSGGFNNALPLPDEVMPSVSGPSTALESPHVSASPDETTVTSGVAGGHQPRSPTLPEPERSVAETETASPPTSVLRRPARLPRPVDRLDL